MEDSRRSTTTLASSTAVLIISIKLNCFITSRSLNHPTHPTPKRTCCSMARQQELKLAHFNKHELYSAVHGRAYPHPTDKRTWTCLQIWQHRETLSDRALKSIHWHALGKAFRKYPNGKQRWLVKHETGQCGVGRMQLRRKYQDHRQLPQMQTKGRNDATHHPMSSHIGNHQMEHSYHVFEQLADKIQN